LSIRFGVGLPRDFWILLTSLFLINALGTGFSPFLPFFLREVGAGVSQVAWVLSFSQIFYAASVVVGGLASDLVGRKLPLVLGPVVIGASYFALSTAKSWEEALVPLAVSWVPVAFTAPAVFAYIGDVVDPSRYGRAFGIYFALMNISSIAGYLVVGFLIEGYGYSSAIFAVSAAAVSASVIRVLLREPHRPRTRLRVYETIFRAHSELRRRVIALLVVTRGIYLASTAVVGSVLVPLWAREVAAIGESSFSLVLSVEAALYSILAPIGGRLVEGGQRWVSLSVAELLLKFPALALLASAYTAAQLLVVLILESSLAIFLIPSLDSKLSAYLREVHRGTVWGVQQSLTTILTILLTLLAGQVWEAAGAAQAVYLFLAFPLITIPLILLIRLAAPERRGS
jgi:MFS family permease